MVKPILKDDTLHEKFVLLFESQKKWFRNKLPFEFRRRFLRVFGKRISRISSSNISPELFLKGLGSVLDEVSLYNIPFSLQGGDIFQKSGKAVIIIPTHDNLEYLRLCLNSIWEKTTYPNYDVIVVDNESNFDVVGYLDALEGQNPRIKVIHNQKNIGFAQAINIGIGAAGECQYVVILNDDTIVTRDWLGKLIHYLEDDHMKLVGPVTNWAGNEAGIKADYVDLDSLEAFSSEYCTSHEGRFFDIHMLAMFCVVMRRSLLDEIGFLDERFRIGMFEDDDFSLRVRNSGGRVVCAEDVFIHHWGRMTISRMSQNEYDRLFDENKKKFEAKWQMKWQPHRPRI